MLQKGSAVPRTFLKGRTLQQGFSLLELVVVFVIVGVLAASALRYYADLVDGARKAGIQASGNQFAAVVSGLHAQWYINQVSGKVVSPLLLDDQPVYLNERGWPANTSGETAVGLSDQTAEECVQLWDGFSRLMVAVSVEGESTRGSYQYHVSAPQQRFCRYELVTKKEEAYYFEYDLRTGRVEIVVPTLNSSN